MRAIAVLFLATFLAAEPTKLPEPYQSLVDLAQAAPPEFAADALLRVVESGKIADHNAERELVDQAFHLAATAKFPFRMRGLPGTTTDTRSGFLSRAYDFKLDALSLQSRALRDMLPIDNAKARELFQDMPQPTLPPLTCDDPMVYDVSAFYQTVAAVADAAFSGSERAKDKHINFVLDYLGQATSPAQLAPLAAVAKSVSATPAQREILWNRFNGLLESLQPDGRSYSATLTTISSEIGPEAQVSFEKYKQSSKGCPHDASDNKSSDHTPKLEPYWQSDAAKQLLQNGLMLRTTADGHTYSDAERATPEWQERLADYLSEVAAWTSGQENSEADYYHQKCIVFEALVELIPPGPQRDKALIDFVDFISTSGLQQQSPAEWFTQANSMLDRVRTGTNGELAKLSDAFQHSGSPILTLEVALEKVLGAKQPGWITGEN